MFANCQMGGQDFGFPGVRLTPMPPSVTPLPYPSIAMGPTAVGAVYHVMCVASQEMEVSARRKLVTTVSVCADHPAPDAGESQVAPRQSIRAAPD